MDHKTKLSQEKLEDIKLKKKNTYTHKLFCAAFVYEIRNTSAGSNERTQSQITV